MKTMSKLLKAEWSQKLEAICNVRGSAEITAELLLDEGLCAPGMEETTLASLHEYVDL